MHPAVFLDRDGVVINNTELVTDYNNIVFEDTAADAIKSFNDIGMKVIIVTNQPQVARGMCSEADIKEINERIRKHFLDKGAVIDHIYFCPHHPEQHSDVPEYARKYRIDCECRKPKTGMITRAIGDHDIDISRSFMIGDRTSDILAGKKAGMKTILVETGSSGKDGKYDVEPDYVCKNIGHAARLVRRNLTTKAVILAGGRGERLMPLTKDIPKPMIGINGKPVLEHQISLLKKYGITEIILCSSYLSGKIKEYFSDGAPFGVRIYYPDEEEPLGTGGAIKNAEKFIGGAESIFVLNGDVMTKINVSDVMDFHERRLHKGYGYVRAS
ncbi:HAD-IIIA family hydrolase [archaeon]|nr:HAD-IIIA family hydrolase [archaeon]